MAGYIGNFPTPVPLTSADLADSIITSAKIADGTIVNADINASADIAGTKLSGVGISEYDVWRLTSTLTSASTFITSNLARVSNSTFEKIGTGMSESSGVFTFPSTGYWLIKYNALVYNNGQRYVITNSINTTSDNSTYSEASAGLTNITDSGADFYTSTQCEFLFKVSDVSNYKCKFYFASASGTAILDTYGSLNRTYMSFVKIGDI